MRAGADEVDEISVDLIDQEKITADVALAVIRPIAFQGMIEPFRSSELSLAMSSIIASFS